ncbi:MAG: hypothetical protein KUG65_06495 [Sphingomonadaceae bacterium]|nr:hypothetical protein [Sphingomonadaceae bacterium]
MKIGSLPLYIGQSMTIFPEGLNEFTGTVRRADETFAGVEFDRELPHPVFERLRCNFAAREEPAEPASEPEISTAPDQRDTTGNVSIEKPRPKAPYGSLAALSPTRGKRVFGTKRIVLP